MLRSWPMVRWKTENPGFLWTFTFSQDLVQTNPFSIFSCVLCKAWLFKSTSVWVWMTHSLPQLQCYFYGFLVDHLWKGDSVDRRPFPGRKGQRESTPKSGCLAHSDSLLQCPAMVHRHLKDFDCPQTLSADNSEMPNLNNIGEPQEAKQKKWFAVLFSPQNKTCIAQTTCAR